MGLMKQQQMLRHRPGFRWRSKKGFPVREPNVFIDSHSRVWWRWVDAELGVTTARIIGRRR